MIGGALLATPLADRPTGAGPLIKDKTAKELQAAPLQVHCLNQTFSLFKAVARWPLLQRQRASLW